MEVPEGTSHQDQPTIRPWRTRRHWKVPVLFGAGFCALQVTVFVVRFGTMAPANPPDFLFAIPSILVGLLLFFLGGMLVGLFAQRLLRGVAGSWRTVLMVGIGLATPLALLFSLVGGLLGPHVVILGALVPYLVLVGIPMLIRKSWLRFHRPGHDGVMSA